MQARLHLLTYKILINKKYLSFKLAVGSASEMTADIRQAMGVIHSTLGSL